MHAPGKRARFDRIVVGTRRGTPSTNSTAVSFEIPKHLSLHQRHRDPSQPQLIRVAVDIRDDAHARALPEPVFVIDPMFRNGRELHCRWNTRGKALAHEQESGLVPSWFPEPSGSSDAGGSTRLGAWGTENLSA